MNAILRIGLAMNNEFKFYTSYLFFLNLREKKIITNKEFKVVTKKLIEKYEATIVPFMLNIA